MIDRVKLKSQLIIHEGNRLEAYICPGGCLTVGVGRNVEANPVTAEIGRDILAVGDKVTQEEAMLLLDADLARYEDEVRAAIPCFDHLSDTRQNVLIDMAFNMGTAGLMKFRKMLAALEAGEYYRASMEMQDSRWARQVRSRADRLSDMMATGVSLDNIG
ncbi:MAG: glycoside hydrolase family protein [Halieaceae bacterium]